MPSASRRSRRIAATSASSGPRIRSRNSTTVTRDPSRARAWAISRPIGPPPSTRRRAGRVRWEKSVSLVQKGTDANPSIGGSAGREPVAITQERAESRRPSSSTVCGSTKRAGPKRTSAPSLQKRSSESCTWIVSMTPRTRSMTAPRSTGGRVNPGRPNSGARRACAQTAAERIRVLEGTQPKCRQSPPSRGLFSISTVLAPNCAAPAATVRPAAPPPRMPMSWSNFAMPGPPPIRLFSPAPPGRCASRRP